jgi:hypothetical protein
MQLKILLAKINRFYKLAIRDNSAPESFYMSEGKSHITPEIVQDSNLDPELKTSIVNALKRRYDTKSWLHTETNSMFLSTNRMIKKFNSHKTDLIWMIKNLIDLVDSKTTKDTSVVKENLQKLINWFPNEDNTKSTLVHQMDKFIFLIHELITYLFQISI